MFKLLFSAKAPAKFRPTSAQRIRFGMLGGLVGIVANAIVFCIEIFVGLVTGSIAITTDAFHNLADVFSSVVTIFCFSFARKPADKEHPFGHGRIEYIASLAVAFLVLLIGFNFLKSSVLKIMHPTPVQFQLVSLILILCTIPFKLLLSLFNRRMGNLIHSSVLKASSVDALSDVGILAVAMVSLIAAAFSPLPIDGYLGALIALVILHSGYVIAKDSLNPLLGEPFDSKVAEEIVHEVMSYPYITGTHDLIIHNYGPDRYMASIHAEVPSDVPVMELHESIDRAEKDIFEKYNIFTVIHMDPLNNDDAEVMQARTAVLKIIQPFNVVMSVHDFRVVGTGEKKNLIFDAVVSDKIKTKSDEEKLRETLNEHLHQKYPQYNTVISFDRSFTG